ncbi:LexA family protein [Streptomyces sp. NPDC055400]
MTNEAPTERQQQILRALRSRATKDRNSPSLRRIAATIGLSSPATVAYHLHRLKTEGLVTHTNGCRRPARHR